MTAKAHQIAGPEVWFISFEPRNFAAVNILDRGSRGIGVPFRLEPFVSVGTRLALMTSETIKTYLDPGPAIPLSTLRAKPHGIARKTPGQDGVALSFLVGLFHPLQHAG